MNETPVNDLVLQERLRKLHPLLRATRKYLRSADRDEYGRILPGPGCLDLQVSWHILRRASLITDALLKACEAKGWTVSIPPGQKAGTLITVESTAVPIRIYEGLDREPLSPEQQARPIPHLGPHPVYTRKAGRRLVFAIQWGYGAAGRKEYRESKRFSAADRLVKFIDKIQITAAWLKQVEAEDIKRAERARIEENARWELEKACRAEQQRVDDLLAQTESWHKSQRIRTFVNAVLSARSAAKIDTGPDTESGRWARWAREHADRFDPLVENPPSILDRKPKSFWEMMGVTDDWWKDFYANQAYVKPQRGRFGR